MSVGSRGREGGPKGGRGQGGPKGGRGQGLRQRMRRPRRKQKKRIAAEEVSQCSTVCSRSLVQFYSMLISKNLQVFWTYCITLTVQLLIINQSVTRILQNAEILSGFSCILKLQFKKIYLTFFYISCLILVGI